MKIRHLHINNFGHFADRDIALSDAGLQIIYGPNEAGKTTLLEFLRGWLFDFPTRTPYDFQAGTKSPASARWCWPMADWSNSAAARGTKTKSASKSTAAKPSSTKPASTG